MPHSTAESDGTSPESCTLEPIAICGMACRLPGGVDSASTFWDMLVEKRDGQTLKVPKSRFNIDAHYHKNLERPGSINVLGGYFLDGNPEDFDPTGFNITPIEARWLDPQQRRMLEVSYECLESAGLSLSAVAGSNTAVFIGSFTSDYQQISTKDPDFRHNYAATGVDPGIISNRIGNTFDLRGPSFTINTACSSSVYAIHNACHALRTRDCDAAITGGVNLIVTIDQHMNTAKLGILSPTSFCHTFDASADGYGRAEGAGALYLKRLSDAIRDGDPIRAIIRSSAVNTNGKVAGMGITHPSIEGQERVVRKAYQRANIDPNNTIYAELHGTGTPVGDPIEVRAVSRAMNDSRSKDHPLLMGAVKPNIGHSEAASGIFAVMKAALMTEKAVIPGVARFQNLNPAIKEEEWNVRVNYDTIPWPAYSKVRRAGVSSFGYGGTNAHVIVESVNSLYPFYEHAHDKTTLNRNINALGAVAEKYYVHDLAYTLNERRTMHLERAFALACDGDISNAFQEPALQYGTSNKGEPGIAFMFTGQGAQWAGMGRKALEEYPQMRSTISQLDAVLGRLQPKPTFRLLELLVNGTGEEDLDKPHIAQPAATALQIALVDLYREWGISPSVTVGHSSGEIAAAYAAGLISAPSAILAAYCRGQAVIQSASEGSMLAVGMGVDEATSFISERHGVWIACENSPSSVTLSGHKEVIAQLQREFEVQKIFARELKTGRAYHSPMMEPVSVRYSHLLRNGVCVLRKEDEAWTQPHCDMISSVTAQRILETQIPASSDYWCQNLRQRVLFGPAVKKIGDDEDMKDVWNTRIFLEIGPHSALGGPFRQIKIPKAVYVPSLIRRENDVRSLLSAAGSLWAHGYNVDLRSVNSESDVTRGALKHRTSSFIVDLPPYQWNYSHQYWAEPRASAEQRGLTHARHDILGSRVPGLSQRTTTWRNILRHRDLPWLKDHSLGGIAVFPAAGHMSLAIEALRQVTNSLDKIKSVTLRDINISTALTIPENDDGTEVQFQLQRISSNEVGWYNFTVESFGDGGWTVHCQGKITANHASSEDSLTSTVDPSKLTQRTTSRRWYESFRRVGFQYGPHFQKLQSVRTSRQTHKAAATLSLVDQVFEGESPYLIHPSTVDACLQLIIISIHAGAHKAMPWGVVPLKFEEVTMWVPSEAEIGIGNAVAWTDGFHGRHFNTHSQLASASGRVVINVKNLNCISYEAALPPQMTHGDVEPEPYAEMSWKPDILTLKSASMARCWPSTSDPILATQFITHLLNHKHPIRSATLLGDTNIATIEALFTEVSPRSYSKIIALTEAEKDSLALKQLEDKSPKINVQNTSSESINDYISIVGSQQDLVVLTIKSASMLNNHDGVNVLKELVTEGGYVMLLPDASISPHLQEASGFRFVTDVVTSNGVLSVCTKPKSDAKIPLGRSVDSFAIIRHEHVSSSDSLEQAFSEAGLKTYSKLLTQFDARKDPLVLFDATTDLVWSQMNTTSFAAIKSLVTSGAQVLWLTKGVKEGLSSFGALAEGFLRTVRNEHVASRVTLLDFDTHESASAISDAILAVLPRISTRDSGEETELWLRGGILHNSRIVPNKQLNMRHFASGEAATQRLPLATLLSCVKSDKGPIFVPKTFTSTVLAPDMIEIQVDLVTDCSLTGLPNLAIGKIIECGSLSKRSSLLGKRVLTYAFSNDTTLLRTSVFETLHATLDAPGVLSNLPDVLVAAQVCIKMARVQSRDKILILPGSVSITAAIIRLCRAFKWDFKVVAESTEARQRLYTHLKVLEASIVVCDTNSSIEAILRNVQPSVVVAHRFSSLARDTWRNLPPFAKLIVCSPFAFSDTDTTPFERGASLMAANVPGVLAKGGEAGKDLLTTALSLYRSMMFPETPCVQCIHELEPQVNGDNHDSTKTKILRFDYDCPTVKVVNRVDELRFKSDATYLLIGCLGGLGRSLTTFMRERGACNFAFISRSGTDKPEAAAVVADLESTGASVAVHRIDAGNGTELTRIVQQIEPSSPLKGVVHAAMVLKDGLFENMTFQNFQAALAPKVDGADNLHRALNGIDLDFFVMTSSISAVVGNTAQANYSAANSYLDQIAWQRNLAGQTATSLALPMVLDVGVVAENDGMETALARKGMYGIDESEMIKAFEVAMMQSRSGDGDVAKRFSNSHIILGLEAAEIAKTIANNEGIEVQWYEDVRFCHVRRAVEDFATSSNLPSSGSGGFPTALKAALVNGLDAATTVIVEHIVKKVSSMLMISTDQFEFDGPSSVASYGLDSMIGAEMRSWLFKEFKLDIPFQTLLAPSLTYKGLAILAGKSMEIM